MIVATIHGIWSGKPGYADGFFAMLRSFLPLKAGDAYAESEMQWKGAWLGPLAVALLGFESFRSMTERPLRTLFNQHVFNQKDRIVLVSHSLGSEISRGFLATETLNPPPILWVTAGVFGRLLGIGGASAPVPDKTPLHMAALAEIGVKLQPAWRKVLPQNVTWVNCYYPADPLGQALAPLGAPCIDVPLHLRPSLEALPDHMRYWNDSNFAKAVAEHIPRGS